MKTWNAIKAVSIKEVKYIIRDPVSCLVLFLMPFFLLFGFILSPNLVCSHIAVLNGNHDPRIEELFNRIDAQPNIVIVEHLNSEDQITEAFTRNNIKAVIAACDEGTNIFIDYSDPRVASNVESRIIGVVRSLDKTQDILNIRYVYNPTLQPEAMPVPLLIEIILLIISSIMLSMCVSREKEQGSVRLLALTPISSAQLVLGKVLPYAVLSLCHILFIFLLFHYAFGIEIQGSAALFLLLCMLFSLDSMAHGLLFATWAKHQLEVVILCWLVFFIPNVFLCGYVSSIAEMPGALRVLSSIMPGTAFMNAYLGIVCRGTGFAENILWFAIIIAQIILISLLSLSGFTHRYSKSL